MEMLPSSKAIVPQMKIAPTGLTRKAAIPNGFGMSGSWWMSGVYM